MTMDIIISIVVIIAIVVTASGLTLLAVLMIANALAVKKGREPQQESPPVPRQESPPQYPDAATFKRGA